MPPRDYTWQTSKVTEEVIEGILIGLVSVYESIASFFQLFANSNQLPHIISGRILDSSCHTPETICSFDQ